jgi:mitogen-activated protein kinase kinase kinase ANP1
MKKEVSLLRNLSHDNIVKYYQTDLSEDISGIDVLLEFVPGGSLKRILQKFHSLEVPIIRKYSKQLLDGLKYLHDNNIIHRDLKSANVLISPSGVLKLTDFGSSRKFDDIELQWSKSLKGSPYWMAPEVVNRKGHSYSADIWSFGCVLIEMVTGHPPWSNYSHDAKEVLSLIAKENSYPDIPVCDSELKIVITACIQRDSKLRPSPREILEMPFFNVEDNDQN